MSDTAFYEDQYESAPQSGRWTGVFGGLIAAVLSLTMLGGVVAWAYQISVRDAHDVPIVRAIEDPMKQRPVDPGGLKEAETDASVTRMVSGDAGGTETKLAPANDQPAPEDKPVPVLRQEAALSDQAPKVAPLKPTLKPTAGEDEPVVVTTAPSTGPVTPAPTEPKPTVGTTTGTPVQTLDGAAAVTRQAPPKSPIVIERPKTLDTTPAPTATASKPTTTTKTPVIREDIVLGVPVVQLGAFGTRQKAERAWQDQQVVNRRLFRGLDSTITTVQSGGQELFRLRVGPFASTEDAKKVCVVLKARGSDCIVTRAE